MSRSVGRVFTRLARVPLNRGIFQYNNTARLNSVRPLAQSSHLESMSKNPNDEQTSGPIKFTTSKASHRTWKVDNSMGSNYERPLRRVLPISVIFTAFLLWCVLREETDVDKQLAKPLEECLAGLRPDDDNPDDDDKPDDDKKPS